MSLLKIAYAFIKYKFTAYSRKGHGIHSPFVFGFVRNVLYKSIHESNAELDRILNWHSKLRRDNEIIFIREIGAAVVKKRDSEIKISSLVKRTGITKAFGKLFFYLIRYFQPDEIIELGTGSGVSAAYLAAADKKIRLNTIEGDKGRFQFAVKQFEKLKIENIHCYHSEFDDFLEDRQSQKKNYGIFIDGNHTKEATLKYFEYFLGICDENSFIVFDDINWSEGMRKAWKHIKDNSQVSISLDMFSMGIVFLRKGITKQNFVLNF